MKASFTKASILKNLKAIYWCALKDGKWQVALQAAKLRGQHIGMFGKQLLPNAVRIADMTEEQLVEFIDRLETRDPSLKDQEGEPSREEDLPEKEPDKKGTGLETPTIQGEGAPEGKHGNPADPATFTPLAPYDLSRRGEEPIDTLYPRAENPAGDAVSPQPNLEWEKPPPLVWSVF